MMSDASVASVYLCALNLPEADEGVQLDGRELRGGERGLELRGLAVLLHRLLQQLHRLLEQLRHVCAVRRWLPQ